MHKSLYFTLLSIIIFSCNSQRNASKNTNQKNLPISKTEIPQKKHELKEEEGEYFKINIGDISKNDNTISYGSIVGAEPRGFKVVKTYFPAVAQNFRQKYIILHYTALDDEKSIRVLTTQQVSSHYLVNNLNDNEIYQLVDENKRAYHAGVSYWRKDQNINDTSIGIEIVNIGYTKDSINNKVFHHFPEYQYRKIANLVKDIATRYNIQPTNILGHSDIAPTRKQDPGPYFPWKKLYNEYQLGMWYDEFTKDDYLSKIDPYIFPTLAKSPEYITKFQTQLNNLGYHLTTNGVMDKTTKLTIEAFQYHFRPSLCNGEMDAESWAILQALVKKYPR